MTQILLVEDDPAIATSLKITCKREGWQMTWLDHASSVMPFLQSIEAKTEAQSLFAIILDVGLPDGDGLSLCQSIRQAKDIGALNDIPIVFLTARSDEVDRILGLELGGDDYCAKPFSPRELVARLKAIWRREVRQAAIVAPSPILENAFSTDNRNVDTFFDTPNTPNTLNTGNLDNCNSPQALDHLSALSEAKSSPHDRLTFYCNSGTWHYQPLNYSLFWQSVKLDLSNTERKLLLTLLQAPNQVFSREQLLTAVSDYPDHRLARTIDSHIKSIRKQLACVDDSIDVIFTHRGLGYGLCQA